MVITETLPPLLEKYGDQLQIVAVNTYTPEGQGLYRASIERFDIPDHLRGVPTLIISETVLVGSLEIPERLPDLIDQGISNGGFEWPEIPGLLEVVETAISEPSGELGEGIDQAENLPSPLEQDGQSTNPGWQRIENQPGLTSPPYPAGEPATVVEKFNRDPLGNSVSVFVLSGMVSTW